MIERAKATVKTPEAKSEKTVARVRQPKCVSPYAQVTHLQRSIGNQAVQRLFKAGIIQAELRIGQSGDIYEKEANRVADQVMRMPDREVSGERSAVSSEGVIGGQQPSFGRGNHLIQLKPG